MGGCVHSKHAPPEGAAGAASGACRQLGNGAPPGAAEPAELPCCGAPAPAQAAAAAPAAELPSCGGGPVSAAPATADLSSLSGFPPELNCPWNEKDRLASLHELGVLGAPPEPRFDTVVNLMKTIFGVQVASVSLIDYEEITFQARAGEWACKAGRAGSFCDWVFVPQAPTMLVVEDATEDTRFVNNKFVAGPPGIRFYAGAPLVATDTGHRYGTLCVIDYKPRHFSVEQYAMLAHFAEVVTRELERDKVLKWQKEALEAAAAQHMTMLRAMDCFTEGVMLCDPTRPGWPILYVNDAWVAATGVGRDVALEAEGFWALFEERGSASASVSPAEPPNGDSAEARANKEVVAGRAFDAHVVVRAGSGSGGVATLAFEFKPSGAADHLRDDIPHIGIPNFVEFGAAEEMEEQGPGEGGGRKVPANGNSAAASAADGDAGSEAEAGAMQLRQGGFQSGAAPKGPAFYFGVIKGQGWIKSDITSVSSLAEPSTPTGQVPRLASAGSSLLSSNGVQPSSSSGAQPLALSNGSAVAAAGSRRGSQNWVAPAAGPPAFHKLQPALMDEVKLGPLIGTGSNGRCYRGLWHGGHVAVKILECWVDPPDGSTELAPGTELQTEAVVEALVSRSLAHPHIVTTFDYAVSRQEPGEGSAAGKIHQQVWILQSYANKGTLFDAIDRGMLRGKDGQPNLLAVLTTASEIAGAMAYIHSHGVLHGDLTPNNVLLTTSVKDGRRWIAQVSDFGLSRTFRPGDKPITTDVFGTVTHMPPELLMHGKLSTAADVYGFGVMLVEMWSGVRAWKGLSPAQILHVVSTGARRLEPPESAPPELQGTMRRCLDPDPDKRPSFQTLMVELEELRKAGRAAASTAPAAAG